MSQAGAVGSVGHRALCHYHFRLGWQERHCTAGCKTLVQFYARPNPVRYLESVRTVLRRHWQDCHRDWVSFSCWNRMTVSRRPPGIEMMPAGTLPQDQDC